jgi:uncharacterized protein YjlB
MSPASTGKTEVVAYPLRDDGAIPNNDRLPLLVYPSAVTPVSVDPALTFESLFRANGWAGTWRNGVYPFHHYHAEAHEVLGIASGEVTVLFGGEDGVTLTAKAGDVVVIPAGVGHKRVAMAGDLCVVGAYPPGQRPDMRREDPDDRTYALTVIPTVPLPPADPVYGGTGPLTVHWAEE